MSLAERMGVTYRDWPAVISLAYLSTLVLFVHASNCFCPDSCQFCRRADSGGYKTRGVVSGGTRAVRETVPAAAEHKEDGYSLIALADQHGDQCVRDRYEGRVRGLNYQSANPGVQKAGLQRGGGEKSSPRCSDTIKAHHLLPIARMVVFKDSVTARVHPEWTIRQPDGSLWRDKKGIAWVNPYHHELWDYNIGVAEELVKLGFGEIQFDHIRFPEPYKQPARAGVSIVGQCCQA